MKRCTRCDTVKDLLEFYDKRYKGKCYKSSECKGCTKDMRRIDYAENTEKHINRIRRKRIENPEKIKEYNDRYNNKNREKRAEASRQHRKDNKEKCTAHRKIKEAVQLGRIMKPCMCSICGSPNKIEGHHEDYNKPLLVIWLCAVCHRNVHFNNIKLDQGEII